MAFRQDFIDALKKADTEYEITAVCYLELLNYVGDTDMKFISSYMGVPISQTISTDTFQFISGEMQQMDMHGDRCGTGFRRFREALTLWLEHTEIPDEIRPDIYIPVRIFYIISAIDFYVGCSQAALDGYSMSENDTAPLNHGDSQKHCLLYRQERESFLSHSYEEDDPNGFRRPHRKTRIGTLFDNLLFLLRESLPPVLESFPQIVRIPLNEKEAFFPDQKIRIASIPFTGFDTFRFHSLSSETACEPGQPPRGSFYAEYLSELENANIDRLLALVRHAVQQNANLIVLPEFIMSPGMLKALQRELQTMPDKKRLLLVFAGTCFQAEGDNHFNNVLHLYHRNGAEIGCYYKHAPFLTAANVQIHGAGSAPADAENPPIARQYLENCEILSNPGKECVLVDIDGIGRILPSICRDMIDGCSPELARLFLPSFIVIPAWSPSVSSFHHNLLNLANTVHAASLLCNCCNAVGHDAENKKIGTFYLPAKSGSTMNPQILDIRRNSLCAASCRSQNGCIVMIEVDFSRSQPTSRIADTCLVEKLNRQLE